jgi:hypothetical protein
MSEDGDQFLAELCVAELAADGVELEVGFEGGRDARGVPPIEELKEGQAAFLGEFAEGGLTLDEVHEDFGVEVRQAAGVGFLRKHAERSVPLVRYPSSHQYGFFQVLRTTAASRVATAGYG